MGLDIVVISLASATKRRQQIDAMFANSGLVWSFFDAHTSLKHPSLQYDESTITQSYGRKLTLPQIAVSSSHVAVLSNFLKHSSSDHILVLEDDIIFDVDFPLEKLRAFCVENSIDYIRLFGKHYADAVRLGFFYDRSILRFTTSTTGGQAYMMSKNGAKRFTDSFISVTTTFDLAMDFFWKTGLPIYAIFPYPVIERYSPTSIPIPPSDIQLSRSTLALLYARRAVGKLRKIVGNLALRSSDKAMQNRLGEFRQIFEADQK